MDDFDFVSVTLTKKTYQELLEKAKKCDEFVKKNLTQCEQLMDCTIIPNNDLEKLKYKAKEYDGIVDEYWNRGGKSQVLEWKEKAKRMDYLEKCHPMITTTEIDELKEKAKKLDEIASGYAGSKSANFWTDQYVHSLEEKVKKWDSYCTRMDPNNAESWIDTVNKAKKWDEYQNTVIVDGTVIGYARLKQLEEKAKKWDEYVLHNTNHEQYALVLEKARKWDEFERKNLTQCEQLMDCTIIQNEDLDELKKKARIYDRMKELFG